MNPYRFLDPIDAPALEIAESLAVIECPFCRKLRFEHVECLHCSAAVVTFEQERIDGVRGVALYRTDCRACNLRYDVTVALDLVQRFKGDELLEEPRKTPGMTSDTYAAILMADALCGDAEKRKRKREVWSFELREILQGALFELRFAGCPHPIDPAALRSRGA